MFLVFFCAPILVSNTLKEDRVFERENEASERCAKLWSVRRKGKKTAGKFLSVRKYRSIPTLLPLPFATFHSNGSASRR